MEKKKKIAILVGGPSAEHKISLKTGEMVQKNLNRKKFKPFQVKINKDGAWPMTIERLKKETDIAFVAMHGKYGEDGQVQSLLETFQIPYTGSDPIASAIAMNKTKTMELLRRNNHLIPEYFTASKKDSQLTWHKIQKISMPVIIKPNDSGSSIGVSLVSQWRDLPAAIKTAFKHSDSIIIQKYISGREISCGVLEINSCTLPLLPTEIKPANSSFFNYQSKYKNNGSEETTPPKMPEYLIKKIQQAALATHKIIGCSGMSRTDMILSNDGKLYILELNTIPGLTETSLLPQAAAAMGIKFPQLLEIIINGARRRR